MSRFLVAITVSLIAVSCSKNSESDDLSQAQACLDNVPLGDYSAADACLPMVKDYTSQQAMILRCSIIITSGGLMEDQIDKAYNAFTDSSQTNKTAAYMAALSLYYPTIDDGYTKALQAQPYCNATGINGYKYLASLIVSGTFMSKVAGSIDITDPTAAQTAITNLVNDCVTTPTPSCTNNIASLGSSVTTLAQSYCSTSGADANVCTQVNSAVSAAGDDPSTVGKAMLCYLNHTTYSPTDGLCH